ncbi:MAG: Eco57I restriction-modification methylase domain-containing protein, partial [Archaeoglobaceae archaeon]
MRDQGFKVKDLRHRKGQKTSRRSDRECEKHWSRRYDRVQSWRCNQTEGEYDVIITNPPYGLRVHRKGAIEKLYRDFLASAKKVMSKDS